MNLNEILEQLFISFQKPDQTDVNEVNSEIDQIISNFESIESIIFLLKNPNFIVSKTASFVLIRSINKNKECITPDIANHFIEEIMQIYPNLSEDFLNFISDSIGELTYLTDSVEIYEFLFQCILTLFQDDNKIFHCLYLCSMSKILQMDSHYDEILAILDKYLEKNIDRYYQLCYTAGMMLFLINSSEKNEERTQQLLEYFSNSFHQKIELFFQDFNENSFLILRDCIHQCFLSNFFILPFNENFPLLQQIILSPNSSHYVKYQAIDLIDDMIHFQKPQLEQDEIIAIINFKLDVSSSFFQLEIPEQANDFDCGSNLYQDLFSLMEQNEFEEFLSEKLELCVNSDDINIVAPLIDMLFHVPEWQLNIFREYFQRLIEICANCLIEGFNDTLTDISSAFLITIINFYKDEIKEAMDMKPLLDAIFQCFCENQITTFCNVILCLVSCFDSTDAFFAEYFEAIVELYHSDQLSISAPYTLPTILYYFMKISKTTKNECFDQILSLANELISSDSSDSFISSGIHIFIALVTFTIDHMKEHIPEIVSIIEGSLSSDDISVLIEGHNLLQHFLNLMKEESIPYVEGFFGLVMPQIHQYCEEDLTTAIGSKKLGFSLNSLFFILCKLPDLFANESDERSQLIESLFIIINKAVDSDGSFLEGAEFLVSMFEIFGKNQIDLTSEYFSILNKLIEKINVISDEKDNIPTFVELCDHIYNIFIICSSIIDDSFCSNLLDIIFDFIQSNKSEFIDESYIFKVSHLIRIVITKVSNRFAILETKINQIQKHLLSSNIIISSIALSFLYPFASDNNTPIELISLAVHQAIKHLLHFPYAYHKNASYFLMYLPNRENLPQDICEALVSLLPLIEKPSDSSDSLTSCFCLLFNRYECFSLEQLIFLLEHLRIRNDSTLIPICCLFYNKIVSIMNDDLISPYISSFITLYSSLNIETLTQTTDINLLFETFQLFSNIITENEKIFKSVMLTKNTEVQESFTNINNQLTSYFSAIIEEEDGND